MDFGNRRNVKVGGGGNFSVLNGTGKTFWKPSDGINKIEILPYIPHSNKHPLLAKGLLKKGDPDYNLDVFVHRNVGANNATIVCPKRNYGQACPLCEEADRLWNGGDKDNAKKLFAQRRVFYNIINTVEQDKGIQLYESAPKTFQDKLEAAQNAADSDPDIQEIAPRAFFADPKNGLSVKITGAQETFNNNKFIDVSSVVLSPRKIDVTPYLDKVVQLEDFLTIKSYDELADLMAGVPTDDEEQEEVAEPVAQTEKAEEVAPPPAPPKDDNVCSFGHVWGKDNDMFPEDCSQCPLPTWKRCSKAQ
jgi:hypothetical protein